MDNRYIIWPFTKLDTDEWTLPDEILFMAWDDLVARNRMQQLFYTGRVSNVQEFVDWLKDPMNVVIFVADNLKQNWAAISWTNAYFPPGGALIHYTALGNFRMGAMRAGIEWWKSACYPGTDEPILKVLLAMTPATNRGTVKLMRHLGFATMEVPNLLQLAHQNNKIVPGIIGALNLR